jgi:regulator of sigma E protease
LDENLKFIWDIMKTALGIGFVIFVHELGHFLLAKWNGVKVERFSIGFGRTLISYRKGVGFRVGTGSRPPGPDDPPTYGETEYVLAVLPLGGYVKMLGESLEDQSQETVKTDDPRSFTQKSVFARMQIITAGVIMNFILAVFCFAFVYSQGWTDTAAHIGGVLPGGSAYKAGLRPGDDIVAIDGRRDVGYSVLRQKVNLSAAGQKVVFTIKRPGVDKELTLAIEPIRYPNESLPTIGVLSSASLDLVPSLPYIPEPGQKAEPSKPFAKESEKDKDKVKLIAFGPEGGPLEPVADYQTFLRKTDQMKAKAIVVQIERTKVTTDNSGKETEEKSTSELTIPPHHFLDLGFRMTPGPIAAIRDDSPAQRSGLKEGDRIIAVDGVKDYDPMTLPDQAQASAGKTMKLTIAREIAGKPAETIEVPVTPDDSPAWANPVDPAGRQTPLDVPGLGLALAIEPKIQAVAEGSPAAKAGLKPGQVLKSIVYAPKKGPEQKSEPKAATIELDRPTSGWPLAFNLLQQVPMKSIKLNVVGLPTPIDITAEIDPGRFHPTRGLQFLALAKKYPPQGLAESLRRGFDETVESALNVVFIFRNLGQGRVGYNTFSGILPIAQMAYVSASVGWVTFIHFLGMLSVNLAVLNFLPIPPLDGGQFLILAAEKVRGKPLPESWLNGLMLAGVVFVLALIILINGKDVWNLLSSYLG